MDNIQLDIQGMNLNDLLKNNDIQVRIGTTWYMLDEIGPVTDDGTTEPVFPIMVFSWLIKLLSLEGLTTIVAPESPFPT